MLVSAPHLLIRIAPWLTVLAACAPEQNLNLQRTWGDDPAIITLVDEFGSALLPPIVETPGAPTRLSPTIEGRFRIVIEVFKPQDEGGPPLAECGVSTVDLGGPLPEPDRRLSSQLLDEQAFEEAQLLPRGDLRPVPLFFGNCQRLSLCDGAEVFVSRPDLPAVDLMSVVSLNERQSYFGGRPNTFGRFEDQRFTRLAQGELPGWITSLAQSEGRVLGVAERPNLGTSALFLYRPSDDSLVTSPIEGPAEVRQAFDDRVAAILDGRAALLTRSSTEAEFLPGAPANVTAIRAIAQDNITVIANERIHRFDGQSWTQVYAGNQVNSFTELHGDRPMMAIGPQGVVLERTPGAWSPLAYPFESVKILAAKSLGQGRFIAGGELGPLAIWDGDDWCRIDPGAVSDFRDFSLTPDGRTVMVAGSNASTDSPPTILTINLP